MTSPRATMQWSAPSSLTLAHHLREQLARDLARSPTGPARAPDHYLQESRRLLLQLAQSLGTAVVDGQFLDTRNAGQDLRDCAVTSRLLQAASNAVSGPLPSAAAWQAAGRFLSAAESTVADLLGQADSALEPPLRG